VAGDARERVLAAIVAALGPFVGANMVRSAVRMHAAKLGLGPYSAWDAADVDRLLAALAPGLYVFVGRNKTAQALDEIRSALGTDAA
jgi:hypothetical protein